MRGRMLNRPEVIAYINENTVPLQWTQTIQRGFPPLPALQRWDDAFRRIPWTHISYAAVVLVEPDGRRAYGTTGCGLIEKGGAFSTGFENLQEQMRRFQHARALENRIDSDPTAATRLARLEHDIDRAIEVLMPCFSDPRLMTWRMLLGRQTNPWEFTLETLRPRRESEPEIVKPGMRAAVIRTLGAFLVDDSQFAPHARPHIDELVERMTPTETRGYTKRMLERSGASSFHEVPIEQLTVPHAMRLRAARALEIIADLDWQGDDSQLVDRARAWWTASSDEPAYRNIWLANALVDAQSDGATAAPRPRFAAPRRIAELGSSAQEKGPSLTCDELEIFFGSNRLEEDPARNSDHGPYRFDILTARRPDRSAPFAEPVPALRNARCAKISADALTLYFARESAPSVTASNSDLFAVRRADRGSAFGDPVRLDSLNSPAVDANLSITRDDTTVVFQSNRKGSIGEMDLWISTRAHRDAPFSTPRNLTELNTPYIEAGPSISADGLTIYFSSDRPGGQGEADIWVARRPTRSAPFGAAEPVVEINSAGKDKAPEISCNGRRLYFRSKRPGSGQRSELYVAVRERVQAPQGAVGSDSVYRRKKQSPPHVPRLADDPGVGVQWATDLDEARARARREGKPVFLAFNARRLANPAAPDY